MAKGLAAESSREREWQLCLKENEEGSVVPVYVKEREFGQFDPKKISSSQIGSYWQ